MVDRKQLQDALALIADQGHQFGEATVVTAVAVLEERLASLPSSSEARNPDAADEQRKQVTILFAAIDGFTQLASTTQNTSRLRQIDLLWQQLDETILYYGGVVDKHMGDVIMGIFGTPIARENDPERAILCAMTMREQVSEFLAAHQAQVETGPAGPEQQAVIRIGINTGQVLLGQVGSDAWQTAIGDAVNVASRLKEAARESGIYISHDTYRLVRKLFRVETLGDVSIKGRQTPVLVYRIAGALPRLFFPMYDGIGGVQVPMVGRETEMDLLRHLLNRAAQEGRGNVVTIIGDAGVGKSRLVAEFHRHLSDYPFKVTIFQARTDQRLGAVPFSFLRDFFIRHFAIEESDRAGSIEEKIMGGLAATQIDIRERFTKKELRERARAISKLVGLGTSSITTQLPGQRDTAESRARAVAIIIDYLTSVIRHSAVTLIFLEDIHWADEDSLAVLEKLASAAGELPLLMLCMARPTLRDRRTDWPGEGVSGAVSLPLRPLDETESHRLVLSILHKLPQVPPALSDLIVRSAAGNPFYVVELVRVLIDDGVIVADESGWYLRPQELTRLRVPATLTGVLQARLDRLPEVERVTLQQAAVVGDEFWAGALQQINRAARFPFTGEQVAAALAALERRDMIVRSTVPTFTGDQAYFFRHAVLREVAYESVLLRDRPGFHLQAVRWLESQVGDRIGEYAAPIAQHYEQAGRPADAARMYELAADIAAEQYKPAGAINSYRKVLELLSDLPQYLDMRLSVQNRLGRILQQQGRMIEALEVYRSMYTGAELDGNLLGQARAEIARATIHLELGNYTDAAAAAEQAEQLAHLTGADMDLALAQLVRGETVGRMGDNREAQAAIWQALERGRTLDAPRGMARGLALAATFADDTQARQAAIDELTDLAQSLAEQDEAIDAGFALARLGEFYLEQGLNHAAWATLEQALEMQRPAANPYIVVETLRLLGVAAGRIDEPRQAMALLEEAAALAETTGNHHLRLGCRLAMGEVLLGRGDFAAAEATLRQVIAVAEDRQRLGNWIHLGETYKLLVEVLNRQGRREEARLIPIPR